MRAEARALVWAVMVTVVTSGLFYGARPASARQGARPSSPELIEAAVEHGDVSRAGGVLFLAYALGAPGKLPARFRSDAPWDGTLLAMRVERAARKLPRGRFRTALRGELAPEAVGPGAGTCSTSAAPKLNRRQTPHFYIEYDDSLIGGGLTIGDYARSLERSFGKEVTTFGWARPPAYTPNPAPNGKYHVRIDALGPGLYGYVSDGGTHAGRVGNNPATSWDEGDSDASCMVLNQDYSTFPGSSRVALNSTTAHELNHSLQFGYGALSGPNRAEEVFVEGGATWMEDEVFDGANDNYNYLYPAFKDDMGEYGHSPYPYWITWRGFTERYGTGAGGGGEQVMQDFWELTSRNKAGNLKAMNRSLRNRGTTLARAYRAYAIAVKFNRRCGGRYSYPRCFQEGPAYRRAAGPTRRHGTIHTRRGRFKGRVRDNYSLNWVRLPSFGRRYTVTLKNTSRGGRMALTVACDTGSRIRVVPATSFARHGGKARVPHFRPSRCKQTFAVVTNLKRTAANPTASKARSYRLVTSVP